MNVNEMEENFENEFTLRNTNFSFKNNHRDNVSNLIDNEYGNEYDKMIQMKEMNM